jgi:hypothetical protein
MNSLSISTTLVSGITSITLPQQCQSGRWGVYLEYASMGVAWGSQTGATSPFAVSGGIGVLTFKLGINSPMEIYNAAGQQRSELGILIARSGLGGAQKTTIYEKPTSDIYEMAAIGGGNTLEIGVYDTYENMITFTGAGSGLAINLFGVSSPATGLDIKLKLIEIK